MAILVGGLILTVIILVLTYFLRSSDGGDPSIPYARYGSYPIIGHLIPFIRDRKKLLFECRQRYGECFRIRVFNQYYTMIISHADWMSVIKNPSFQFAPADFGAQIFDMSPDFHHQPEFDADSHRLYVQHLKNREGLRPMIVTFIHRARQLMKNDKAILEKDGNQSKWISTGLLKFSHHMLYEPSTLALMGDIKPSSLESDFRLFDSNFHYLIMPFPRWFASRFLSSEYEARSRLNESWLKNPDPPDPKALATIKEEIDKHLPIVPLESDSNDSDIEDWTPEQLNACVYLESTINEALRLAGAPFMTRKCRRQAQLTLQDGRTVTMKEGETVAWFGGASHFDSKLFPQPNEFVFDRFLNKKAETVPGFMPFGGGKSICPGRFFAKSEIKTCTAMLLRDMEYKLPDTETIPTPVRARVGFGIAPPTQDIPIMYRFKI